MLFELPDELFGYPLEEEVTVLNCITNILIGYYEGNHLLMANDSFCEHFKDKITDDRAKRALRYLENHSSYQYDVDWQAKIVLKKADPKKHEIELRFFARTSAIQPTTIIGEHLNDAFFYYYIMCSMININDIVENTAYIPDLGGGSSSVDKINYLFNKNGSINLGIFDSDKKFPDDKRKERMAIKLSKFKDKKLNIGIDIINVMEVENLIPLSFVMNLHKDKKRILQLINKNCPDLLNFYDFKEGLCYKEAYEQKYYDYLKEKYEKINPKKCGFDDFIRNERIKTSDKPIIVFQSVGKDILKSFVEKTNVKTNKPIKFGLFDNDSRIYGEWRRIARLVYTYTCSRKKDPIN